jgi:SNF2 family DNA or RNA helicase
VSTRLLVCTCRPCPRKNDATRIHTPVFSCDFFYTGKTIQVIALLAALLEKSGTGSDKVELKRRERCAVNRVVEANRLEEEAMANGQIWAERSADADNTDLPVWVPILIVIPPSIIQNWVHDFETWAHVSVAVYQGNGPQREKALDMIKYGRAEVLLCPKSQFQACAGFKPLTEVKWKLIIVDEFHNFKNVKGHLSKNLRSLTDQQECIVIGLTGTLMQNNHKELW